MKNDKVCKQSSKVKKLAAGDEKYFLNLVPEQKSLVSPVIVRSSIFLKKRVL
jgi:hypothetical protein